MITSKDNGKLKLVRALQRKQERVATGLFACEGEDLCDAALAAGIEPVELLVAGENVAAELLAAVSTLPHPARAIGVFRRADLPGGEREACLALWQLADPGNVGTLVRTAAALGADWLALGPGSADAFHPRAVRAAMGSTFALPVLEGVAPGDLATRQGFAVVAAVPRGGAAPWDADLTGPMVLALGAERAGLGPALEGLSDGREVVRVTIPQAPGAESLNVAAAGAALMAEAVRQRGGPSGSLTGR